MAHTFWGNKVLGNNNTAVQIQNLEKFQKELQYYTYIFKTKHIIIHIKISKYCVFV